MKTLDLLLAALEFFSVGEFENEVLDDEVRSAADMLYNQRRYGRETLDQGSLAVIYADHVTAQQQAEIARLNARVAELEAGVVCEFNRDDIVETCDGLFYVLGAHHGDGRLFVCSINGAVNEGAELEIQFCDVTDHWPESTAKNKMDWQNWKAGAA